MLHVFGCVVVVVVVELLLLLLLVLLLPSQVMTHQGALLNSFYFAKSRGRGRGSRSRDRDNSRGGAAAAEVTEAAAELAATPSLPREKKSANIQV